MAINKEGKVIGIDLGTSYSCVAVWNRNHVEIIPNEQGNRTTPSCVAFTDTQRLMGDAAINQLALNPHNTVFDVKRLIGRRFSDRSVQQDMKLWPFKVIPGPGDKPMIAVTYKGEEKKLAAEEISSMVLLKLKEVAEAHLGHEVKGAVITVPAYFNNAQRQSTKDAAEIAGFDVKMIMSEPAAAAIAYGLDTKKWRKSGQNVLVFDLGGGTFDVSLVILDEQMLRVKATVGDTHLGGVDFDNNLVKYFVDLFKRKHNRDITEDAKSLRKLRSACEKAKRILSSNSQTPIELDSLCGGIGDLYVTVTRALFEKLNKDLFTKCMETVEKCLIEAKISKSEVDELILVGGSIRIPKIQQLLKEMFSVNGKVKELRKGINPDEAVAYGAAVRASIFSSEAADYLLPYEVMPFTLGIEADGGVMSVLIPRNTMVPTTGSILYSTIFDNQTSVLVEVYEGAEDENLVLGKFKLSGFSPAPKIRVCLDVDFNGFVNISAEDESLRLKKTITIGNKQGRLRAEEMKRMVRDAERYKKDDEEVRKKVKAKNSLEKYAYEMRDRARKLEKAAKEIIVWLDRNQLAEAEEFEYMEQEMKTAHEL